MALQATVTNGVFSPLMLCISRASLVFPVPDSPVMMTLNLVFAALHASCLTFCILMEFPTMFLRNSISRISSLYAVSLDAFSIFSFRTAPAFAAFWTSSLSRMKMYTPSSFVSFFIRIILTSIQRLYISSTFWISAPSSEFRSVSRSSWNSSPLSTRLALMPTVGTSSLFSSFRFFS